MILGHTIALEPTAEQAAHFRRACGTARFAFNWGLAEWQAIFKAGGKPSMGAVKRRWNEFRRATCPWSYEVTKCASNQAIIDLGKAFNNFFQDVKKPKKQRHFRYPRFKKKAINESFGLWNDQFSIDGCTVRIAKLGVVKMHEPLRLQGEIMTGSVSFSGGRWFLSVQVEGDFSRAPAPAGTVCGIDLGSRTLATIAPSDDPADVEPVEGSKARRKLLGRVKRQQRRISLQKHRAKKAGQKKSSRRQYKRQLRLSKLHARIANIRKDAAHKLTNDVTRRFETVVIEDLNVSGMVKNHNLAGAVLDAGFHEVKRQLLYKSALRGGRIVLADRFYPSTQICSCRGSVCGPKGREQMNVEAWTCVDCGAKHSRDGNAAINLRKLGLAKSEVTRGDMTPLCDGASLRESIVVEPRTDNVITLEHV